MESHCYVKNDSATALDLIHPGQVTLEKNRDSTERVGEQALLLMMMHRVYFGAAHGRVQRTMDFFLIDMSLVWNRKCAQIVFVPF